MNNIPDHEARARALDPSTSFIVQAPAGSGKTELLIQRYLRLLANVEHPEEILAITFTQKAAAEMKSRVLSALLSTTKERPTAPHAQKTWDLATAALSRDKLFQWDLLKNPNRMRIQTIDALSAWLASNFTNASGISTQSEISTEPYEFYLAAAHEVVSDLEKNQPWSEAVATLLLHLDNQVVKVEQLIASLLGHRDQWLPYVMKHSKNADLKQDLEKTLRSVTQSALQLVFASFSEEHFRELKTLYFYSQSKKPVLQDSSLQPSPASPYLETLPEVLNPPRLTAGSTNVSMDPAAKPRGFASIASFEQQINMVSALTPSLFSPKVPTQNWDISLQEIKEFWLDISTILLTTENTWRKQVTIKQGFPSVTSAKTPEEKFLFNDMKERFTHLIEALSPHENLRRALQQLRETPPLEYPDSQWKVLNALLTLLPIAVAQLSVLFQKQNKIDFVEQSLAALRALYEVNQDCSLPTELALALDYKIEHILVDEFQDTALNQIELLHYLTSGWQVGDGRSLFLVGDPMQSIYRFRKAEVGLFLEAQQKGLDAIALESLFLTRNFRSESGIVDWVNQTFAKVFPPADHIETGAVSFKPSQAVKDNTVETSVHTHPIINGDERDEALDIIHVIKSQTPETSVAILVKSRSHLVEIINALHDHNMPFHAVEIAALHKQPVIQDLLSLTRALFDVNDRIAWLSVLRAPWCGLSLGDLTILSNQDLNQSIWDQCKQSQDLLSTEGQRALKRTIPILDYAVNNRFRTALSPWIKQTWLRLGGPACVTTEAALEHAESFFELLADIKNNQADKSTRRLEEKLSRLFSNESSGVDSNLHIMTMHKSKGLEFDVVILPELDRAMPSDKQKLIQWTEIAHVDNTSSVLFAPIKSSATESDPIYDALSQQEKTKQLHENARVLYVACTRARKALHLFFKVYTDEKDDIKKPIASSFLAMLWDTISQEEFYVPDEGSNPRGLTAGPMLSMNPAIKSQGFDNTDLFQNEQYKKHQTLRRLSATWISPIKNLPTPEIQNTQATYSWQSDTPRHTGIIIHQILQQMGEQGIDWWKNASTEIQKKYILKSCHSLKTPITDIPSVTDRVLKAIDKTLSDDRGHWILENHENAKCEWAITTIENNQPIDLVIDRTFIADGIFWIIDYKTFETDEILDPEEIKKMHAPQLERYAHALSSITTLTIKLGIYCPQTGVWVEWKSGANIPSH